MIYKSHLPLVLLFIQNISIAYALKTRHSARHGYWSEQNRNELWPHEVLSPRVRQRINYKANNKFCEGMNKYEGQLEEHHETPDPNRVGLLRGGSFREMWALQDTWALGYRREGRNRAFQGYVTGCVWRKSPQMYKNMSQLMKWKVGKVAVA